MRRVLCISPHFPPVGAPDMHRLRQSLPYFREFGWDPVVFAVDPQHVEMPRDPLLVEMIPDDIPIHHVGAVDAKFTRKIGLGNLGFRSWFQFRRAVDRYLQQNRVDLIYFTTTVFTTIALGPHWRRKFGVPFVVDLQDPWRNDYYLTLPKADRPRKFWFDHFQKTHLEAYAMPKAAGVTAVSDGYIREIQSRYAALRDVPVRELVFGFDKKDYEAVQKLGVENTVFTKPPSDTAIVFAGVTPKSMEKSIRLLMAALARFVGSRGDEAGVPRVYFVGTHYNPGSIGDPDHTLVMRSARDFGVEAYVSEVPERRPYLEALKIVSDADILLILGVDVDTYSPSKLAGALFAEKPILAIVREGSNVRRLFDEWSGGAAVGFDGDNDEAAIAAICSRLTLLIDGAPPANEVDVDWLQSFSARSKCGELCDFFDLVVADQPAL